MAEVAEHTYTCSDKGCEDVAPVVPVLNIPAKDWPIDAHQPFQMVMGLPLCEKHAKEAKAADFLTAELRQVVRASLRGKCPPDYERMFITKMNVNKPTAREVLKARRERDRRAGE